MELPVKYSTLSAYKRRKVREAYIARQGGKCYYCGEPLDDLPSEFVMRLEIHPNRYPKGFFKTPVHLHHNHDTDLTIGAVHAGCNAVLWEYEGE